MSWTAKLRRFVGTAIALLVILRLIDWLVAPALPLLVDIFVTGFVIYAAIGGIKRDL
jgi:hypothetical protein